MDDFINKEIDAFWRNNNNTLSSKDELKKITSRIADYSRTDLIAELVGKVRGEERVWNNWHDGHLPAIKKDNFKGWNAALDRAIEIIESYK